MFVYYPVFPIRFLFQFVFCTFVLNPKYVYIHCRRCRQDREALAAAAFLLWWLLCQNPRKQQVLVRMWRNWNPGALGGSSEKLKIEPPRDLAVLPLDTYLREMETLIQKNKHTPMFMATLFTIAKIWKQPKCLSIDEWIKKMWWVCIYIYVYICVHTMEYYSAVKNMKSWHLQQCG